MPLLQRSEPGNGVVSPVRAPVGLQLQSHTALWNGSQSNCRCVSRSNTPPFRSHPMAAHCHVGEGVQTDMAS